MTALAITLKVAGALIWLGYAAALAQLLEAAALGTVLYAVALSGLFGGLAAAGWTQLILREGARTAPDAPVLGMLLRRGLAHLSGGAAVATILLGLGTLAGAFPFTVAEAALTAAVTAVHRDYSPGLVHSS